MLKEGIYGIYFGKSPEVKDMFDLNQKFDEIIKKYLPNSGGQYIIYLRSNGVFGLIIEFYKENSNGC